MRASKLYEIEKKRLQAIRDAEFKIIKNELKEGYEYVRPVNVIKRTLANAAKTPEIREDLFKIGINFATDFLTQKVVPAKASAPVKEWLSSFIKQTVSKYVGGNSENIQLKASKFALNILEKFTGRKKSSHEQDAEHESEVSKSAA